ncbi:MAG: PLP-dependent aminotransferase family protein [Deltaproteobacteria bacterium]|nr:PLP-dependent aminotransferase family protein [Deltaproteobacteria bacterium]
MSWKNLYADRVGAMAHGDVAGMLKLSERPDVISFAGGLPDPNVFLLDEIRDVFDAVFAENGKTALGYGPTKGITSLREWLADKMTRSGRPAKVDECLVTTGGIAALDLICKVLMDPGDTVIVGKPSYLAALHVIRSYQGRFAGVPVDERGMQPEALRSTLEALKGLSVRPKFIYLVPSFQNPKGVTMPGSRRNRIVETASKYGVPIIEDAAYRDLRFEGEAPPILASLDSENVIFINTFSKIFNPGVRIGWITAPASFIETLTLAKQGQDQCASTIGQYAALAFASTGLIKKQIAGAVKTYRQKRDAMLAALEKFFPQNAHWTIPEGGFYTWVTFSDGVDTDSLLPQAIDEVSVAYGAGPAFFYDRGGKEHMRLSYSYVPVSQIEAGIERLAGFLSKNRVF